MDRAWLVAAADARDVTGGMSPAEHVVCSSTTRCGPNHATNEDAFLALPDAGVFVVADGMGGHADGALASRAIVEFVARTIDPALDLEGRTELVEEALRSVAAALWREGRSRPEAEVIGSTVAAVVLGEGYAVCVWAGDSRIYLHRAGRLFQLTRDHNLANLMGVEDTLHGSGAALTRAVGSSPKLDLDRVVTTLEHGDTLLVCSDGLTKVLPDAAIAALLGDDPAALSERLVSSAVAHGARDDVTVITIRYAARREAG
jgi:serine/threonine protein phosphatase PrpC